MKEQKTCYCGTKFYANEHGKNNSIYCSPRCGEYKSQYGTAERALKAMRRDDAFNRIYELFVFGRAA